MQVRVRGSASGHGLLSAGCQPLALRPSLARPALRGPRSAHLRFTPYPRAAPPLPPRAIASGAPMRTHTYPCTAAPAPACRTPAPAAAACARRPSARAPPPLERRARRSARAFGARARTAAAGAPRHWRATRGSRGLTRIAAVRRLPALGTALTVPPGPALIAPSSKTTGTRQRVPPDSRAPAAGALAAWERRGRWRHRT